jgi:hypothetical protein
MRPLGTALWIVIVVFLTFAIHEAAHGLAGALLGYDMRVTINGARPVDPRGITPVARDIISAAGPAVTLVQGVLAAALASATGWVAAFHIALAALWMRILAAVASIRNPNDEARLGLSWDMGYWTLHILVIGVLAMAVLVAARAARAGGRSALFATVAAIAGLTFVVVIEKRLPEVIIAALR